MTKIAATVNLLTNRPTRQDDNTWVHTLFRLAKNSK